MQGSTVRAEKSGLALKLLKPMGTKATKKGMVLQIERKLSSERPTPIYWSQPLRLQQQLVGQVHQVVAAYSGPQGQLNGENFRLTLIKFSTRSPPQAGVTLTPSVACGWQGLSVTGAVVWPS